MSNLSQFTNKQNIKLLWEVLLDELHINSNNTKLVGNIRTVFESNINPFTSKTNPKTNIMDLNKQFLSQVVLAVNRLFPQLKQEQNIKRITIFDEEVSDFKEPYKIEDIRSLRQNDFEKEVEKKRMELENYMTPQKPTELDFSDTDTDGKIKSMDSLIAEKMMQRNLEIETLQNSNYNTSVDPEKWLKPKETSVKTEKNVSVITPHQKNENSKLKHISFDSNNNITLSISEPEKPQSLSKKVTWDDLEQQDNNSIFNKLKKQPVIETKLNNSSNKDGQYVEQKSMPLPEIKQEEIIRNQATLSTSMTNNEPVIPKSEIIKQLNEMNTKIDNLYEIVFNFINKANTDEIIQNKNIISKSDVQSGDI
jgi:hypothetical protein